MTKVLDQSDAGTAWLERMRKLEELERVCREEFPERICVPPRTIARILDELSSMKGER